tara:strand:- start:3211 stop:3744 length:534 start_codon:yes stop_codon:yes gene_type:complete
MKKPWECDHEQRELRRRITVIGGEMLGQQCGNCGRLVGTWWSKERAAGREIGAWDMELEEKWRLEQHEYSKKYQAWRVEHDGLLRTKLANQKEKALDEHQRWWREYSEYLQTPEWKEKRQLVLKRANGLCEGCGKSIANEVHHLTYQRAGNEMLFDLVALCAGCHHSIHGEEHADVR